MRKVLKYTAAVISILLLAPLLLWSAGLWYYQPVSLIPTALLLVGTGLWWKKRQRRPSVHLVLWLLVLLNVTTYNLIPGPTPEEWQKPWAIAPRFEQNGDILTIHHLRDFRYRTEEDSDARYRTETYDLNTLTGVDFAECHWDGLVSVCHTMLSFNFADGRHVVVSAETRLPAGVEQNAIAGIYKQYGILYIFGTEEDIFGLRTNIRHEDLSLYPLKAKPHGARKLLEHYVKLARDAESTHKAYNTISDNCSTGLIKGFRALAPHMARRYDFLPLHNGDIAALLINNNAVQSAPGESAQEIRRRCYVGYDIPLENYSVELRKRLAP